ncbi:hypothetical protein lacNasYZ03_01700 [Lactobacillus nasalidis]|uniref:GGDEF domain-containing protein n=1 Tax=Lactobacillus nasalidis TaxID=2797258 RepID=A0ABQ3W2H6_9LACO|nr:GGDEF domain-containing protein [Lactobacillus nasalidis]GHW00483.1 hypothetical protein lacNasYZ03_01700 [Lactobacillus nasalidis]
MNLEKINYYGDSREVYDSCLPHIEDHNLKSCTFLIKLFVLALGIFTLLSLAGLHRSYFPMYFTGCLANLLLVVLIKKTRMSVRVTSYSTMALLLTFAIADSSIDPHHVATTYLVFAVLVAVLLMDTMLAISAFYLLMLLVFSLCSYVFKGQVMWQLDSFNGLIYTIASLALHYVIQKERLASYLLLNKYNESQRELWVQANFDRMSGVMNRSTFMTLLQKAVDQPECGDLFVGLVDIDHFKQINDSYGHRMGDLAIQELSRSLEKGLRVCYQDKAGFADSFDPSSDNVLARLGGDEFVFAMHCASEEACRKQLRALQQEFAKKVISLDGRRLSQLHFSCGVIHYNNNLKNVDQLYQKADQLMYMVKKQGGNEVLVAQS